MYSLWVVLVYLMADVMGMGHGGDGAGEDPPGGGGYNWHGHQQDGEPVMRRRGKGKNLGLDKLVKSTGGPVPVDFDTECTFHPVGKKCDFFTREAGIYMWRNIPLDREGYRNVEKHLQNALDEHLRGKFDYNQVEKEIHASKITGGISQLLARRFSDRKNKAKQIFLQVGGYANVEEAKTKVPEDMPESNWHQAINHFCTPKHIKRSSTNAACRAKHKYNYRGGSSSYASTCFKQGLSRIEAFYKAHTTDGVFHSPIAEREYNALLAEYQSFISHVDDEEEEEGGTSAQPDNIAVFEKVLGRRRGGVRGIGPIPPNAMRGASAAGSQTPQYPPGHFKAMFQNPEFQQELQLYLASNSSNPSKSTTEEPNDEEMDYETNDDMDI